MASYERAAVVGVDVPIGLSDGKPRQCDIEARAVLRAPRASSVFPPPIRSALSAKTREEACANSTQPTRMEFKAGDTAEDPLLGPILESGTPDTLRVY